MNQSRAQKRRTRATGTSRRLRSSNGFPSDLGGGHGNKGSRGPREPLRSTARSHEEKSKTGKTGPAPRAPKVLTAAMICHTTARTTPVGMSRTRPPTSRGDTERQGHRGGSRRGSEQAAARIGICARRARSHRQHVFRRPPPGGGVTLGSCRMLHGSRDAERG